jgi:hypothetical protein
MVKIHLENLKNGLPPTVENPITPEPIIDNETP